jgi:hypothetical protein
MISWYFYELHKNRENRRHKLTDKTNTKGMSATSYIKKPSLSILMVVNGGCTVPLLHK